MKKLLILGDEASAATSSIVADFLGNKQKIGIICASSIRQPVAAIAALNALFGNSADTKRELVLADANNINELDALYICDANAYLVMEYIKKHNLESAIQSLASNRFPIVAAGNAALALSASLRTAISMPLVDTLDLNALKLIDVHFQVGELDNLKRTAFREFFSIYPDTCILLIPSSSALIVEDNLALAYGEDGIWKLTATNEHFYKSKDYICL